MAKHGCKPQEGDLFVRGKKASNAWKSSVFARNMLRKWDLWWLLWFPAFTSLLSVLGDKRESHLDLTLQVILCLSRPSAGHLSKLKKRSLLNPPEEPETPSHPTYPAISGSPVCMDIFLVAVDLDKPCNRLTTLQVLKFKIGKNFYKYLC